MQLNENMETLAKNNCIKETNSVQVISGQEQMEIVSAYLDLKMAPSFFDNQQFLFQRESSQKNAKIPCSGPTSQRQTNSQENQRKNTSIFHNFQKHLITTLKSQVKIRKISHSDKSKSNIACEIWQYLRTSSKFCKKFLFCLLLNPSKKEKSLQKKYYDDYNKMIQHFNEYSEKEINLAQQYLCRQIIRQSRRLIQSNSFQNRRIQNPQEFISYFQKFIDELQEGKISKRLPKHSICYKNIEGQQKQFKDNIQ